MTGRETEFINKLSLDSVSAIQHKIPLLQDDKDFNPIEEYSVLKNVRKTFRKR